MSAQKGVPISAVELVRQQGFGGLYTGALATALRQSSSVAVRFFCFGSIKAQACDALGHDEKHAPAWVSFIAGGTGGAVSVCGHLPEAPRAKAPPGEPPRRPLQQNARNGRRTQQQEGVQ